jgi:hypothetical protein
MESAAKSYDKHTHSHAGSSWLGKPGSTKGCYVRRFERKGEFRPTLPDVSLAHREAFEIRGHVLDCAMSKHHVSSCTIKYNTALESLQHVFNRIEQAKFRIAAICRLAFVGMGAPLVSARSFVKVCTVWKDQMHVKPCDCANPDRHPNATPQSAP